jgi:CRISPR-associated protein Csm3
MKKLTAKYIISGKIEVITGLHIGGSKNDYEIGGIDNIVIKTNRDLPYIPGSSLKGKLRSLLAREHGWLTVDEDQAPITEIFGSSGESHEKGELSQLLVRDAIICAAKGKDPKKLVEEKTENRIDRKTGKAEHPREMERVPVESKFDFEMVYDEYLLDEGNCKSAEHLAEIQKAFLLLMDDYLGGSGSRGYGKVRFNDVVLEKRPIINGIYQRNGIVLSENFVNSEIKEIWKQ